jgi:hypothetical protein
MCSGAEPERKRQMNAPVGVRQLIAFIVQKHRAIERGEAQLKALGYYAQGYGKDRTLCISSDILPKELLEFDDQTQERKVHSQG